ncbi:DUF4333 domain-containing protein [Cellulomonas triticagri]|nr:DUF4333 domain-containing protein [Cellulomonas triticagri]
MRAARGAAPALLLLLTGCSVSVSMGGAGFSSAELEDKVNQMLEQEVGRLPDDVECPDGLAAEVGESVRCTLTITEGHLGATVTVRSVDGDDAVLRIEVDEDLLPEGEEA